MGDELAVSGGFHAGRLVGSIAPLVGGSGGGRPNLAQAGGKSPEKVAEALDAGAGIVENLFAKS